MTAQPTAPGARTPIGWEGWDASSMPGPARSAPFSAEPAPGLVPSLPLYLGVGLVAGAVIALQICIMRIFSVGSWAHFGSLVVSLAMLAFGLVSAVMCIGKGFFARHWRAVAGASLVLFAPLLVAANLLAQQVPFNAIFLLSDPNQKWRLAANFALYLVPFLAGALFLGTVFLKADRFFARVYFADLVGAGLGGLLFLGTLFLLPPENLVVTPILLALAGGLCWFRAALPSRALRPTAALLAAGALAVAAHFVLPPMLGLNTLAVSDYKGVSYARKFPDSHLVYRDYSPFGDITVYGSSYLHFAPGLSDNAAFNLPQVPENAYLGLYIDGEGPSGIIRDLKPEETAYFRFLPMVYPYLVAKNPDTFVIQFGGGISTDVALRDGSKSVTVAESNPAILKAFRTDPTLKSFTGDVLNDPRVHVVDYDGRLFLAGHPDSYDVVDLSLADSAGLSAPGGFAIVEKYGYTRQAMETYMRALKPGGILSVTLWNKEEPPKSVLKLYATIAEAARAVDPDAATRDQPQAVENSLFAVSTYLSTATVLYKKGGFTPAEVQTLRDHTHAMSFDDIYYPGIPFDAAATDKLLSDYRNAIFSDAPSPAAGKAAPADAASGAAPAAGGADTSDDVDDDGGAGPAPKVLPSTEMGRLAFHALVYGGWPEIAERYVFDTRALTNDRPYFAAYVKPRDLPNLLDRLEIVQDEWGYLLLWATLGIAGIAAASLVIIPLVFGWRTVFSAAPGKGRAILYFACLGLGYIVVEVGLIADYTLALNNATVSASILITAMLVFSGLGSLTAERTLDRARSVLPIILLAIGAILIGYGFFLDRALVLIGTLPYGLRLLICFFTVAPPAYLMGFPMPTAMTWLARLGKEHMFLWAWGINGCFSVVGAAAVPLIATAFGLSTVLTIGGVAYLVAIPAFFAVLLPATRRGGAGLPLTIQTP
jgi:SAM-dependent methyltransferase